MATVYKLKTGDRDYALKVFKQTYRNPSIATLSRKLKPFASLPGLAVCDRLVLEPEQHSTLIAAEPDLAYAIIMPWIEGPTWMDILTEPEPLSPEQSLTLAHSLCTILAQLEQEPIAHCDLSGANLLFTGLEETPEISLVDVEQLYAAAMPEPSSLLVGTPGYGHRKVNGELWGPHADRFSGAVLLAEILSWSSAAAREASWGESFFDPDELHEESERLAVMEQTLRNTWSEDIGTLFTKAWRSTTLVDCPSFAEWLSALPSPDLTQQATVAMKTAVMAAKPRMMQPKPEPDTSSTVTNTEPVSVETVLAQAEQQERDGKLDEAIELYEQAQTLLATDRVDSASLTDREIADKINELALRQITQTFDTPATAPVAAEEAAPDTPSIPVVKPYTPAATLTKKLGGLTQTQFLIAILALPLSAALIMYLASDFLRGTWIWYTISPPAVLGSALYVALRRKWVAIALYSPIILLGSVAVSADWIPFSSLVAIALISGLILETITQLSTRFVSDPIKEWRQDLIWVAIASFAAAAFIEEIVNIRLQYITRPEYWVVNILLAVVGWFIGDYLRQFIIHLREMRKGAANDG